MLHIDFDLVSKVTNVRHSNFFVIFSFESLNIFYATFL